LKAGAEVIGVLGLDHNQVDAFSEDQLHVLKALAGHISVAIENARLFRRERLEREKLHREAEETRCVQKALFPKTVPSIAGFAFETAWQPAGTVAGDWFDFVDLGGGKWGIVIADVSGNGMPAALLMSATSALLRSFAKAEASPARVLEQLNHSLLDDVPAGKFVTMIYGVLDPASRRFTLASAGHPRPLLINGECSFVAIDPGLPLGLSRGSYEEHALDLKPGCQLLLYTDGISEAMDRNDQEYGPARLVEHFLRPKACIETLMEEVRGFAHGAETTDDATAVLVCSLKMETNP
jgi:sigma-B regulation protein RsbU (phosphoserine phosphatase)